MSKSAIANVYVGMTIHNVLKILGLLKSRVNILKIKFQFQIGFSYTYLIKDASESLPVQRLQKAQIIDILFFLPSYFLSFILSVFLSQLPQPSLL